VKGWWHRYAGWLAILFASLTVTVIVVVSVQAAMLYWRGWRLVMGSVPEWFSAGFKRHMDDDEREAVRGEGFDPDDPAVVAAIDLVRWELSLSADFVRPGGYVAGRGMLGAWVRKRRV
jgi:hypothetical protein